MSNIAIIIPSRLEAARLPNKPLKLINKKEMILHVYDAAKNSNIGEVIVALQTLILVHQALKLVVPSEEKKKQVVDVKVVPMHGKLICEDRLTP